MNTGFSINGVMNPLAVTIPKACELSGFGATSIWQFLKDGRLRAVRLPGVRRTLVSYASLERLLGPSDEPVIAPRPNRQARRTHLPAPRKHSSK